MGSQSFFGDVQSVPRLPQSAIQEILNERFCVRSRSRPKLTKAGHFLFRAACSRQVIWVNVQLSGPDLQKFGLEPGESMWPVAVEFDKQIDVVKLHKEMLDSSNGWRRFVNANRWITLSHVMDRLREQNAMFFLVDINGTYEQLKGRDAELWEDLYQKTGNLVLIKSTGGGDNDFEVSHRSLDRPRKVAEYGDESHEVFWLRPWLKEKGLAFTEKLAYYLGVEAGAVPADGGDNETEGEDTCRLDSDARIWAGLSKSMDLAVLSSIEALCNVVHLPPFRSIVASEVGRGYRAVYDSSTGYWRVWCGREIDERLKDKSTVRLIFHVLRDRRVWEPKLYDLYVDHLPGWHCPPPGAYALAHQQPGGPDDQVVRPEGLGYENTREKVRLSGNKSKRESDLAKIADAKYKLLRQKTFVLWRLHEIRQMVVKRQTLSVKHHALLAKHQCRAVEAEIWTKMEQIAEKYLPGIDLSKYLTELSEEQMRVLRDEANADRHANLDPEIKKAMDNAHDGVQKVIKRAEKLLSKEARVFGYFLFSSPPKLFGNSGFIHYEGPRWTIVPPDDLSDDL